MAGQIQKAVVCGGRRSSKPLRHKRNKKKRRDVEKKDKLNVKKHGLRSREKKEKRKNRRTIKSILKSKESEQKLRNSETYSYSHKNVEDSHYKNVQRIKKCHTVFVGKDNFEAALSEAFAANDIRSKKLSTPEDTDGVKDTSTKDPDHEGENLNSHSNMHDIFQCHDVLLKPLTWKVYMLDTVTSSTSNLTVIGNIPVAWLSEEKWRLHTFAKYPHDTAKSAILLAKAGFAYIGSGKGSDDTVFCVFCKATKQGWREDESIEDTHRTMSPSCPMVTGTESGNIPLIAPTNVAFATGNNQIFHHTNTQNSGRDELSTDSVPGASGFREQRQSTQRPKPVQMATSVVMAAASPPSRPLIGEPQVMINTVSPGQPTDEDGPVRTVTSSNTAHAFSGPEASSNSIPAQYWRGQQAQGNSVSGASNQAQKGNTASATSEMRGSSGANSGLASNSGPGASSTGNTIVTTGAHSSAATPSSGPNRNTNQGPNRNTNQASALPSGPNRSTSQGPNRNTNQANAPPAQSIPNNSTPTSTPSSNPPSSNSLASSSQAPASQNPTYHQLGIITERPKRYEHAVRYKRLETFADWPRNHHLKKEDLADAGFYYAGYGDCARCFYCGGGLRNWEQGDDVWVEHARWFPKCAYIRQRVGQVFVDTVAHFARDHEKITFQMVVDEMKIDPSAFQIESKHTPLKHDPAVLTVKQMGFREVDILPTALSLKESGQILSSDILFTHLKEKGVPRQRCENDSYDALLASKDMIKDQETVGEMKQKINDLRLQTLCKICMDKEVAVVFLPCGHLVCCTECASAMKDCPVCRKQVKGIVRAFIG